MRFKNKVVVISGGGSGIGLATTQLYLREGAKTYVLDINRPSIENNQMIYYACDVSSYHEVTECINKIKDAENQIDILFCNAGIHHVGTIEETSVEDIERVVQVNLLGTIYLLKEVLPVMKKNGSGTVVLMGSDQSLIGKAASSIYGCTKGAIGQLTKSTAIDYARYGIRVNAVCPGTIHTPLYERAVEFFSTKSGLPKEKIIQSLTLAQPIARIGMPDEVAKCVLFLSSEESSFTTGSLYSVDGGYTAGADRVHLT